MVIEEDSVKKKREARSIVVQVDGVDVDMVLITRVEREAKEGNRVQVDDESLH
jgi:hypothetical protein